MVKKSIQKKKNFSCKLIDFPEMSKKETKEILKKLKKLSKDDLEIVKKIRLEIGVI